MFLFQDDVLGYTVPRRLCFDDVGECRVVDLGALGLFAHQGLYVVLDLTTLSLKISPRLLPLIQIIIKIAVQLIRRVELVAIRQRQLMIKGRRIRMTLADIRQVVLQLIIQH